MTNLCLVRLGDNTLKVMTLEFTNGSYKRPTKKSMRTLIDLKYISYGNLSAILTSSIHSDQETLKELAKLVGLH